MVFVAHPAAISIVVLVIEHKRPLLWSLESVPPLELIVFDEVLSELIFFPEVCLLWLDLDALVRQECDLVQSFLLGGRVDNEFTPDAD